MKIKCVIHIYIYSGPDGQMGKQKDILIDRQMDGQIDRQMDRQIIGEQNNPTIWWSNVTFRFRLDRHQIAGDMERQLDRQIDRQIG